MRGRTPGRLLGLVCRVGFGGGREIEAGLDKGEFSLGRSQEIIGILGGEALDQRVGVGKADVLDRCPDRSRVTLMRSPGTGAA